MMRFIVSASLQFRFIVAFLALALVGFGASVIPRMPVDVFPEFAPPVVEIQTEAWGMSSTEIEDLVNVPLEQALQGTPGLAVLRSKAVPGLSAIRMIFKVGTNQVEARQLVAERLAIGAANLPKGISIAPFTLPPLSATSRVMKIGITSEKYSVTDLSMIVYWTMRWKMMTVPGVAGVVMWGERLKQLQVQVNPELMRAYDVPLTEIEAAGAGPLDTVILLNERSAKSQIPQFVDKPNQRQCIHY
jgi:Cu/Ag efflux pump CusA